MTRHHCSFRHRLLTAGLLVQLTAVAACTSMLGIDDDYVEAYPTTNSDLSQLSENGTPPDAGRADAKAKPDADSDATVRFSCPEGMTAVYGDTSSWCIDELEVTQAQYDAFLEGPAEECSSATNLDPASATDPLNPVIVGKAAAYCFCQTAGKALCKHPAEEWDTACVASGEQRGMLDGAPEWVSASFEFEASCVLTPWNCDQYFLRHTGTDCSSTTADGSLSSKPQAQIRCCADIDAE